MKDERAAGREGNELLAKVEAQCEEHKAFLTRHIKVDPKLDEGHRARLLDQVALLEAKPAPIMTPADAAPQALAVYTYEDELYAYLSQPKSELPSALHSSRVTEGITLPESKATAVDPMPKTGKTKHNAPWRD